VLYSWIKKLHVLDGSGHHQVLSFDSLKIFYTIRVAACLMRRSHHQTCRHANCIQYLKCVEW